MVHTSNYNFSQDKKLGDEGEDAVLAKVKEFFPQAYRVTDYEPRWDIVIPEIEKTIEVKTDKLANRTGNLAVERSKSSGAPSGIMVSEADLWICVLDDEILMMGREALKGFIEANNFPVVWGGDRNSAEMYLVPLKKLKQQDFLYRIG